MTIRTYFDDHAVGFDALYLEGTRISHRINRVLRRAVYERFTLAFQGSGDVRDRTVLDIGCGSGRYMVEYARRGARSVVGVDLSPAMLDLARRLVASQGVADRCSFLEGDFLELALDDRAFDVVIAMGFFDYVADPLRVLRKMVSVSRGRLIASFPGRSPIRMHLRRVRYQLQGCPVHFYGESELRQLLDAAGVERPELIYMPHSGTGWVVVADVPGAVADGVDAD